MVLLVSAITARGQATALIANGDGTFELIVQKVGD